MKQFPEEPFDLDESKEKSLPEFPNGLVSQIGYNIEQAALRQRDFFYQVSWNDISRIHTELINCNGEKRSVYTTNSVTVWIIFEYGFDGNGGGGMMAWFIFIIHCDVTAVHCNTEQWSD